MKQSYVTEMAGVSVAACTSFVAAVALGAVTNVTGDVILMAPPASVLPDAPFNDTSVIHGFVERRDFDLPALIAVDQTPGGTYLMIPAGTCVTVYMLHFDATTPSIARGRLELDTPILGVISTQQLLDQTNDTLGYREGDSHTEYPTPTECQVAPPGSGNCGLEFNDVFDLKPQSIDLELHANGPGDRVRIIAQCDP